VSVEGPEKPFKVEIIAQIDLDLLPAELPAHRRRPSLSAPKEVP